MTAKGYLKKGKDAHDKKDFKTAIENFTKALELNSDLTEAYFFRGNAKDKLSDYNGAIKDYTKALDDYTKALESGKKDANVYYGCGMVKYELKKYKEALDDYTKAFEYGKKDAEVYCGCANAKDKLLDYNGALEDYNEAIKLNQNNAEIYNNRGNIKDKLSKYEDAIKDYTKAIELGKKDEYVYCNCGNARYRASQYKEAIDDYNEAINFDDKDADLYCNRGIAKNALSKHNDAIDDFTEAVKLNGKHSAAYFFRGVARATDSDNKESIENAIQDFTDAIKYDSEMAIAYKNRGELYTKNERYEEAEKDFAKARTEILFVIGLENGEKMAEYMVKTDKFFKEVTENCNQEEGEKYKDIYLKSLKIVSKLHVQIRNEEVKINEMPVAYYTKKDIAEKLLFTKDSFFHLNMITTSNDPEEGKTLFHYLFPNEKYFTQVEEYGAFAGCFTFNTDSLNQFRLYGKTDNEEGTGISIVLNQKFFNEEICIPVSQESDAKIKSYVEMKSYIQQKDKNNHREEHKADTVKHQKILPLFRCIYIDPKTGCIVSLGQKEEYVLYRESKEYANKNILGETLEEVREKLKTLKEQIEKNDLNITIVYTLLLNLRYLIKHVAFKEEQECRIINIKKLAKNDNTIKTDEYDRLYIDYLQLNDKNVEGICFGPKAKEIEKYRQHLAYNGYSGKECYTSTAPFA